MANLTKTQTLIVALLAQGLTAEEIANQRFRALGTVRKHIESARERMGARNVAHLVYMAMQQGILRSFFIGFVMVSQLPGLSQSARVPHRPSVRSCRAVRVRRECVY